jgi:predicted secreted protein
MKWTSILAIYFIMWFMCLFIVLPFHGRREGQGDGTTGHDPGAPDRFQPGRIIAQVSIVAALVFGLYYANYVNGWVTVQDVDILHPPAN